MAFNRENLAIVTNHVKAGDVPSLWTYYNEANDSVIQAGFFEEARLTVGDQILVMRLGVTGGMLFRVSAKPTEFTATVVAIPLQVLHAQDAETLTVATNFYDEISTKLQTSLLVTKNANVAVTFTTSATAGNYCTFSKDVYDGVHVVLTSTTTLPAGLAGATPYYLINSDGNRAQLSLTRGGDAVAITGAGTGTHTATVQKNFFILQDGYEGQRKIVKVKTDGGIDAVILPDHLRDGTLITAGDATDSFELEFIDGYWELISNNGVAVS